MMSRSIPAGSLNQRITLQSAVETKGTSGSPKITYIELARGVPARVQFVRGKEKYASESMREVGLKLARFTIRYRGDVNSKTRIVYDGENYDVLYIAQINKREGLEITAQVAE